MILAKFSKSGGGSSPPCPPVDKCPEVQKDFIFHYDIPVSLVIDKKLYKVIDKMFESNSTLHQALGAVPEKREILLVAYPYK